MNKMRNPQRRYFDDSAGYYTTYSSKPGRKYYSDSDSRRWKKKDSRLQYFAVFLILVASIVLVLSYDSETGTINFDDFKQGISDIKSKYVSEPITYSAPDENYLINPKEITLSYILRGDKNKISMIVYQKLSNHLSLLPRTITTCYVTALMTPFFCLFLNI